MPKKNHPLAAIDIGSNTVHVLVATGKVGRPLTHLYSESELLELGREVSQHGKLSPKAVERVIETLERQIRAARKLGAKDILIAATGAFRRAKNGAIALRRIEKKVGIPIRLLTGKREAALAFAGAKFFLHPTQAQLMIDSGGASTEVTLSRGHRIRAMASLPVGAAVLSSQLKNDPPLPLEWAQLMIMVADTLALAPTHPKPKRAIATGGSAHRFEELLPPARRNKKIRIVDLEVIAGELLRHHSGRIAKHTGHEPRRVALLAAAALILHAVLSHYQLKKVKIIHAGLRDGMIHAFRKRAGNWWR